MNKWRKSKISEVCDYTTGNKNAGDAVDDGEYVFYTCDPEPKEIDTYEFEGEAVLLAGNNANGIFHTHYHRSGKFDCYQRTYVIRSSDDNILLNRYLYYLIELNLGQFKNRSIGTATQYLTQEIIDNIELQIPPIETQKRIVSLLDSIDRKIKLNRKIAELLNETASAIYNARSKNQDNHINLKDYYISDIAEVEHKRVDPSDHSDTQFKLYSFSAYDEDGFPYTKNGSEIGSSKYKVPDNCVLVTKLNPRIPRIWKVTESHKNAIASTEFVILKPNDNKMLDYLYMILNSEDFFNKMKNITDGTSGSHQRVDRQDILQYKFSAPMRKENLDSLYSTISNLTGGTNQTRIENQRLEQLRDYLLPQLLRGEVIITENKERSDQEESS